jgi:hypothetical protein
MHMAKKPPATLKIADLTDTSGAVTITGLTRSRIHQLAEHGDIPVYIFMDGELVEAEGIERQGKIALFNRYDLSKFRDTDRRKGGRPRKSSLTTSQ